MEVSNKQKKINILFAQGYNPIHLFGDVYLVRHQPQRHAKLPLYLIKIIREDPLDKREKVCYNTDSSKEQHKINEEV